MRQKWYILPTSKTPAKRLAVRFYRTDSGGEPVRDWLAGLDKVTRATIGQDIKTVEMGWPLGMPLVRKLDEALWEVRIGIPAGIARILFTVAGENMVLLHGFAKKSRKTPQTDLALAKRRMRKVFG